MDNKFKDQEFGPHEILQVLWKHIWLILLITMVITLSVGITTLQEISVYQASARILIEQEQRNAMPIQQFRGYQSKTYFETQLRIIKSRGVARKVIKKLKLDTNLEFKPSPNHGAWAMFKGKITKTMDEWLSFFSGFLKTREQSIKPSDKETKSSDSALVSALLGRIQVESIKNSHVVDVKVTAKNPSLAAKIANEVVAAYIAKNLEVKFKATQVAVKWLSSNVDKERAKVEEAEIELLNYKETNRIITAFSSESENITAEKLVRLNEQVMEASSQRVSAETRYKQARTQNINNPEMLDSIPEVLSNPLVQEIKKMEVSIHNRMSELSKKYGLKHPQMQALESELTDLQQRKTNEIKRIINSLRNQYKLALAKEQSLKTALRDQKNESLSLNQKAIQYGVLKRNAENSRNMYELLIKKFKETSLAEDMKPDNIRIIDNAEIPRIPISPKPKRNIILALLAGLAFGIGVAVLYEYTHNTIKKPDDINKYLNIPFLGHIENFDAKKGVKIEDVPSELITSHTPNDSVSEAFRTIRTGILFSSIDQPPKVIMVTSADESEGKTLCVANLAVTMAKAGSKVALIDCDLHRPRIHSTLGINKKDLGIYSFLVGDLDYKKNIIPAYKFEKNLFVIPSGKIIPNPLDIIDSREMEDFINILRNDYDRILIDAPPISAVTDPVILSQIVDGIVLVIHGDKTSHPLVKNCIEQLSHVNTDHKILGAILNKISINKGNNYYYSQHYNYGYYSQRKKK